MEPGHPGPIKHRDPQPQDSWCRYSQLLLVQAQREAPPGEWKRQAVGQHHPTQQGAGVRLPYSLLLAQLLGGCMPQGHIQEAATYCAGGFSFFLMPM